MPRRGLSPSGRTRVFKNRFLLGVGKIPTTSVVDWKMGKESIYLPYTNEPLWEMSTCHRPHPRFSALVNDVTLLMGSLIAGDYRIRSSICIRSIWWDMSRVFLSPSFSSHCVCSLNFASRELIRQFTVDLLLFLLYEENLVVLMPIETMSECHLFDGCAIVKAFLHSQGGESTIVSVNLTESVT